VQDLIRQHCTSLRLGTRIAENYKQIKADTHEEFLEKLLRMEVIEREVNRKNRLIKQAKFDVIKTFENYSFENIQMPQSIDIENLKTASFIDSKENLILYGSVGTGKTHLATAIGIEACNQGKRVAFYRTAALVNELITSKKDGNLNRLLKRIEKTDLLICDEWGYIPFEREGSQLLFGVISECYEKRSLIITTNLEFSKWNGIFYDEKLTSAIIDRVIHHSHLLIFSGSSFRLKNSKINTIK
jgi:DNA replication protein DnaC